MQTTEAITATVKSAARWAMTADLDQVREAVASLKKRIDFSRQMGAHVASDKPELEALEWIIMVREG